MTDMSRTTPPERHTATGTATASDRRDEAIREALEQDEDQAAGAIDSERRDARRAQDQTATQRQDARDAQDEINIRADTQRQDARDAQDKIDIRADTQRQDARDAQDEINIRADTQRQDARDAQDEINVRTATQRQDARDAQDEINIRADTQRQRARNAQDKIDIRADTQRRDARNAQDQAETAQDSERRDAQNQFDARRDSERRDAFEQNVTDRQQASDLEQANQNLEAFAYTVSHDLRAPLRAMNGFSEALLEEYGGILGEEGRGYAERIQAASEHMSQLIDALLHLARISRAEVHLRPVDVGAEATAIAAELEAAEPGRSVRFTIQRPAWALADQPLIRTVLENLLGNAWKFTAGHADPSIELWMAPEGDTHTRFYIRDNGAGFDPAQASKLFTPFERLHTMREFPGTGVGLTSVRQIIEHHGGHVQGTGAPGEGATFSFTLTTARPHDRRPLLITKDGASAQHA
jgi:signal transduction histidine kinase